jgi:hypothetical protein
MQAFDHQGTSDGVGRNSDIITLSHTPRHQEKMDLQPEQ